MFPTSFSFPVILFRLVQFSHLLLGSCHACWRLYISWQFWSFWYHGCWQCWCTSLNRSRIHVIHWSCLAHCRNQVLTRGKKRSQLLVNPRLCLAARVAALVLPPRLSDCQDLRVGLRHTCTLWLGIYLGRLNWGLWPVDCWGLSWMLWSSAVMCHTDLQKVFFVRWVSSLMNSLLHLDTSSLRTCSWSFCYSRSSLGGWWNSLFLVSFCTGEMASQFLASCIIEGTGSQLLTRRYCTCAANIYNWILLRVVFFFSSGINECFSGLLLLSLEACQREREEGGKEGKRERKKPWYVCKSQQP